MMDAVLAGSYCVLSRTRTTPVLDNGIRAAQKEMKGEGEVGVRGGRNPSRHVV